MDSLPLRSSDPELGRGRYVESQGSHWVAKDNRQGKRPIISMSSSDSYSVENFRVCRRRSIVKKLRVETTERGDSCEGLCAEGRRDATLVWKWRQHWLWRRR